jgi:L-ascorbate metabolism protein UlaG (beta-lactamase superfamily)
VPTNVRELGGTRYNGNSIFVFEVAELCIAHLGHLHHTLTATHLAELGAIDVVMVPVDGTYTLNQDEMIEVLRQIGPKLVIPMHIFSGPASSDFWRRQAASMRSGGGPPLPFFSPARSCRKPRRLSYWPADRLS